MEKAGVSIKLPEPVLMNAKGGVIFTAEEAYGLPVDHDLIHDDYTLFVDKVGNNTNIKGNSRVGGEKTVTGNEGESKEIVATKNLHCTTLGFTAATGEPVICAHIFDAKEMLLYMQLGIDIRVPVEASSTIKENCGLGKQCPGGPTCKFHGKYVPCFVCCSPKGGITSDLLTQMLQRMDVIDLFPRKPSGPIPFLLLDGHHSQFQLPFLKYINDPSHLMKVCIGVPNGTAFW